MPAEKNGAKESELPPETQTGAYTFGCNVNGKVFVPRDGRRKPGLYAQYVNLGSGSNGGWHLNIPAYNYSTHSGVTVETDSLLLVEGRTYEFKSAKRFPIAWYEDLDYGSSAIYGNVDSNNGFYALQDMIDQTGFFLAHFSLPARKSQGVKL